MNKLIAVIARLENPRPKKALPLSLTKRVLDGIEAQLQSKKPADAQLPLLRSHPQNGTQIPSTYQMLCKNWVGIQPFLSRGLFRGFQLQKRMGGVFFLIAVMVFTRRNDGTGL
jgi:hypothetical protein